jgi:ABC-type transport system involved in multi-copper enzyme maturation permease subunit
MLLIIIRRELLDNLKSLRLTLTFVLVAGLMIMAGVLFAGKYQEMVRDHSLVENRNNDELRDRSESLSRIASYTQELHRSPNPMRLCAEGYERWLPNLIETSVYRFAGMRNVGHTNFMMARFPELDWSLIIGTIISFAAVLVSYDAISGERERGTLRLTLSTGVSRGTILFGKYLGIMVSTAIPLLAGILVNLATVTSLGIPFSSGQWARIAIITLISLIYVSSYIMLGLFVSARTCKASTSLAILLLAWVILTILIPSSGGLLASELYKMPTAREIAEEERAQAELSEDEAMRDSEESQGPVDIGEIARRVNAVSNRHINMMIQQVKVAQNVTRLSPTAAYNYACEAIAGTGALHFRSFRRQVDIYLEQLRQFAANRGEGHDGLISRRPAAFEDIPKFREQKPKVPELINSSLWDLLIIALFNIIFFMAAYLSFIRYDVR